MSEIVYPDYSKSVLNLITSILKYYNVETNHTSLGVLDEKLNKEYKNIVLIILDGMGEHILNNISPNGFFRDNEIECITSVCPATTTAAITTYYSGKPPYETGWIGWSQYFKEYGRVIDMLPHRESYQNNDLSKVSMDVFKEIVNYESVFEQIEKACPEVKAYEVEPDYADRRSKRTVVANTIEEICDGIEMICSSKGKHFVMAYSDYPDGLLHDFGCGSNEVKNMILDAETKIQKMCENLEDTLIIVSADHGHKEINKVYNLLDYPELLDCLIMPASIEIRFVAFWVRDDKKEKFENLFNQIFAKDFILFTKEELLQKGLLGPGIKHKKIDDFIGNYVAISTGDAMIRLQNYLFEGKKIRKSTHCGLSKEEMEVPVIVVEK